MKQKEICDCDYPEARIKRYGPIVLCNMGESQCPYGNSLKWRLDFNGPSNFRCITDGKIEKIVKKDTPEEVLVAP